MFRFCLLRLVDHGTSWSLHSAAGFSLETRIILSSKITWVDNHRGNSVNFCRNNKKEKILCDHLIKTYFILVVKAPKSADVYGRLVEAWREETPSRSLVTVIPQDHCPCSSGGHRASTTP